MKTATKLKTAGAAAAFTLIELPVVIAIIAILAAMGFTNSVPVNLAIPQFYLGLQVP